MLSVNEARYECGTSKKKTKKMLNILLTTKGAARGETGDEVPLEDRFKVLILLERRTLH